MAVELWTNAVDKPEERSMLGQSSYERDKSQVASHLSTASILKRPHPVCPQLSVPDYLEWLCRQFCRWPAEHLLYYSPITVPGQVGPVPASQTTAPSALHLQSAPAADATLLWSVRLAGATVCAYQIDQVVNAQQWLKPLAGNTQLAALCLEGFQP